LAALIAAAVLCIVLALIFAFGKKEERKNER
jgi:hypothetical protein